MSSNRPGESAGPVVAEFDSHGTAAPGGGTRSRRPMTLRTKLIAGFVALIVVVFAVIGVVTELFLSRYLVQQLDNRVNATAPFPRSQ